MKGFFQMPVSLIDLVDVFLFHHPFLLLALHFNSSMSNSPPLQMLLNIKLQPFLAYPYLGPLCKKKKNKRTKTQQHRTLINCLFFRQDGEVHDSDLYSGSQALPEKSQQLFPSPLSSREKGLLLAKAIDFTDRTFFIGKCLLLLQYLFAMLFYHF